MAGSEADRLLPFIGGRFVEVGEFAELIEPWARRVVARVGIADAGTVAAAVAAAADAQPRMAAMPVHERARLLRAAADVVAARAEDLAREITRATGKVISHTRRETRRVPWTLRAAASAAETMAATSPPADAIPGGEGVTTVLARRPVGTVAAITPFNAPLNLVAHKVAPALAVGNCVVVKPAPQAPAPRGQHDEFAERLAARAAGLRLGDPMDDQTDIGPLIGESSAIRVESAIAEAVAKGAVLHTGGTRRDAVIAPTVLSHVDHGLSLYCDEVFAPVVIVEAYDGLDDAIDAANSTPFALQAAVFTSSLDTATRCFAELRAGSVVVNRSSNFRLDQLPYGGIAESGTGREGPLYAAEAMTYLKSLVIAPGTS